PAHARRHPRAALVRGARGQVPGQRVVWWLVARAGRSLSRPLPHPLLSTHAGRVDGVPFVTEHQILQGRVAVVTGSARNIGRAIAHALAEAGAAVVVNAKSSAHEAETVVQEIRNRGGQAVSKIADVGQPEQAASLIDAAVQAFGRLDILVNNAAV